VFTYHRFFFYPRWFRKGGPLAVTDANLILGRLIPEFFPKIFGKSEKEPLDVQASKTLFEKVAAEINESHGKHLSLDEIVYGYVLRDSCWIC
jgi:5-oxoprolinase (ATP-hydrolysing)